MVGAPFGWLLVAGPLGPRTRPLLATRASVKSRRPVTVPWRVPGRVLCRAFAKCCRHALASAGCRPPTAATEPEIGTPHSAALLLPRQASNGRSTAGLLVQPVVSALRPALGGRPDCRKKLLAAVYLSEVRGGGLPDIGEDADRRSGTA